VSPPEPPESPERLEPASAAPVAESEVAFGDEASEVSAFDMTAVESEPLPTIAFDVPDEIADWTAAVTPEDDALAPAASTPAEATESNIEVPEVPEMTDRIEETTDDEPDIAVADVD